jgi:hypothetical protein
MPYKIVDYAPKRTRRQPMLKDLIPGLFILGLCALAPSPLPNDTTAAALSIPGYVISPIPTPNRSLFPSIPMSENLAGQSAVEVSESKAPGGQLGVPVAARSPEPLQTEQLQDLNGPVSTESVDPVQVIREVFGPEAHTAIAIARAESGLRCDAHSGTEDLGLFQIHISVHREKFNGRSPYDCRANAEVAKQIYDRQGWEPWVVFKTGAFRRYL